MPGNDHKKRKLSKRPAFRLLPLLLISGVTVHLFLSRMTTLESSLKVVKSMSIGLIGLAILAEIASYLGSGYLLKAIMNLGKSKFSIFRGALINLAAVGMGSVMGGWVTAMATTFFWISKDQGIADESKYLGFLPPLYNNSLLILLAGMATIYLFLLHDLSKIQIVVFSLIFSLYGLVVLVFLLGIRHRNQVESLVLRIIRFFSRLFKRSYDIDVIQDIMEGVYTGLFLLGRKGWKKSAVGSLLYIGFDILALWIIFLAAGQKISPMVLISGYCMAFLIGISAFFIPGGVGVIESGMVAVYSSLGIPVNVSVVVVFSYRLLAFWLPIFAGFAANAYLGSQVYKKTNQQ